MCPALEASLDGCCWPTLAIFGDLNRRPLQFAGAYRLPSTRSTQEPTEVLGCSKSNVSGRGSVRGVAPLRALSAATSQRKPAHPAPQAPRTIRQGSAAHLALMAASFA